MNKKIFCITCKYSFIGRWSAWYCEKNFIEEVSFLKRRIIYKHCRECNKDNNCKFYNVSLIYALFPFLKNIKEREHI